VLGANDGLVSTASLVVGVASSGGAAATVLTAGIAGLAAGSMAMAAGEYVSVSSQVDVERGDRAKERGELATNPQAELAELAGIYRDRGLSDDLARQVAQALHDADPLASHLRDELGHSQVTAARPLQAAAASAASFFIGGLLPLLGLAAPTPARTGRDVVGTRDREGNGLTCHCCTPPERPMYLSAPNRPISNATLATAISPPLLGTLDTALPARGGTTDNEEKTP
jgi:hypothetical protein